MAGPGRPKTGGRQKGTANLRTQAREQAVAEAMERAQAAVGKEAFDGDAHAFLVFVYKNPAMPIEVRVDCAKAAVGYEKPRLASLQAEVDVSHRISGLSDDELRTFINTLRTETGATGGA